MISLSDGKIEYLADYYSILEGVQKTIRNEEEDGEKAKNIE